jgi:uncharacterized protein
MMPARVLVTGVSGPIGKALVPALRESSAQVVRLVRGPAQGKDQISWDPYKPVPAEAVSGFDAVIHLAGESIVGRWTAEKKKRIRDSRVLGTRYLVDGLVRAANPPRVLISGSAIGFYGSRGDEVLSEDSHSGQDFLAGVCREWESATEPAIAAGIRTVNIRIGVVLSAGGGALPKMLPAFRMGVGGKIGNGQQWWSWIDVADIVGAIQHVLRTDTIRGPVNLVSPNPVTNAEFTRILGETLRRPTLFPMPVFAARLAFGEMADALLLSSQRVRPDELQSHGYAYQHPTLQDSLRNILRA